MQLKATVAATIGTTYAFRYRARNIYGWSDFSPVLFVLAADVPSQPPRPSLMQATDNSISVQLYPSPKANGAAIEYYVLSISVDGLSYTTVEGYDGQAMTYQLTFATEGLVTGTIYYFSFAAYNIKGLSA
jgi:hypothetical protein